MIEVNSAFFTLYAPCNFKLTRTRWWVPFALLFKHPVREGERVWDKCITLGNECIILGNEQNPYSDHVILCILFYVPHWTPGSTIEVLLQSLMRNYHHGLFVWEVYPRCKLFEKGQASRKSARAWPFIAFPGTYSMSSFGVGPTIFASRPLRMVIEDVFGGIVLRYQPRKVMLEVGEVACIGKYERQTYMSSDVQVLY